MSKTIRIGMLAPISWRTPPQHYGGWELVTSNLTEELVRRGHDVTLFATADSLTAARLVATCPRPLTSDPALNARVQESLHIASVFEQAADFDLIHNNTGCFPLTLTRLVKTPTVTTLHGSAAEAASRLIYQSYADQPYVSISDSERELAPTLNYIATVYNGINVTSFDLVSKPGDYLLTIGRMSPDKGIHLAIKVAQKFGMRLVLAGIVPPENQDYFDAHIKPHLQSGLVEFVGPVEHAAKNELLGGAYAFLHLVTYREAFGLTMVEAMACGTPVVGVGLGSVPELVQPGVSGEIIASTASEELLVQSVVKALGHAKSLDRASIRQYVESNFSIARMADGYEAVYQKVISMAS